ncbi:hypothetical protein F9C07_1050893 [Aspergillus flavus]|uniref:Uncharacterized protein n=5 Tax=Aspergillus subgen. Circumdati TaxID=2720871 RepID=A0A7U2QWU4_ASPFN|nr:hypothetical protein F9C07_1050893 [Aspergillus flavus]
MLTMEPHPMKCDLDEGRLNAKCRDRKFTTFLDLKIDYHNEFINRLREHVQVTNHSWNELQAFESKRRSCAEKFVGKYGVTYWGAETRKMYLLPEAFKEPESLCTYPERKEEIIRTVALLLERKANSAMRNKDKQPTVELDTPTRRTSASVPPLWGNSPYATSPSSPELFRPTMNQTNEGEDKLKRRASDRRRASTDWGKEASEPPSQKPRLSAPSGIRPFSSIWDHGKENNGNVPREPTDLKADWTSTGDKTSATDDKVGNLEGNYPNDTKFLVEASNQEGMAPVWVSFQNFPSASSFLGHMAAECRVDEWSPSKQILTENSNWHPGQLVLAASVKFEWSEFGIRVRQGADHDLTIVFQELQKAWKAKELNLDGGSVQQFRVKVMLHVG